MVEDTALDLGRAEAMRLGQLLFGAGMDRSARPQPSGGSTKAGNPVDVREAWLLPRGVD